MAGGVHGKGVCMVGAYVTGGIHGGGVCDVAGEMATAVGGTHPTGMHSCLLLKMVYFCRGRITEQPLSSYISQVTFNALLSMFIMFLSSN